MLNNKIKINKNILNKITEKHQVNIDEIYECFLNRSKGLLEDTRVNNKTNPPTLWFIAETDHGRLIKVVFIELLNGNYEIKTAYEPNQMEISIYERYA